MALYLIKDESGREYGPFTANQLRNFVSTGKLRTSFHIRSTDKSTWHSAGSIKGLFATSDSIEASPGEGDFPKDDSARTGETVYLPPPLVSHEQPTDEIIEPDLVEGIDEDAIAVETRTAALSFAVQREDHTPAGNLRTQPMFVVVVRNEYLKKSKTFRRTDFHEIVAAAHDQREKWIAQEIKEKVAAQRARLVELSEKRAANLARDANETVSAIKNLLRDGLRASPGIDWNRYYDHREFPIFEFEPEPTKPSAPFRPSQPQPNLLKSVLPFLLEKEKKEYERDIKFWEAQCKRNEEQWQRMREDWAQRRQAATVHYQMSRDIFLREKSQRNRDVQLFRDQLTKGNTQALVRFLEECFAASVYPKTFRVSHVVTYDPASLTVVVDLTLPNREDMPDIIDFRFIKTTREALPIRMKPKDHESLYDDAIKQAVILTLSDVFRTTDAAQVGGAVVNGWVTYLDRATGLDKTSCIISVSADREKILAMDLSRVDPSHCIASLKGLIAGPLAQVAPVKPILHLNREDNRFVESRDVLADLNSATNLAEIGWEEFEHLVRELFSKMFSKDGAEVRVTQASNDGGVDAVAFDPDPIRGGKFVIQAKRYTNVVPVSAVRDLYGTMISEGAAKGIIVTTAHFGRDTREFVKDKPISLIDGPNLVYLLEQHGFRVRLDVKAARANENRDPFKR